MIAEGGRIASVSTSIHLSMGSALFQDCDCKCGIAHRVDGRYRCTTIGTMENVPERAGDIALSDIAVGIPSKCPRESKVCTKHA